MGSLLVGHVTAKIKMYLYIVLINAHTQSNYNMQSVQFILTIITYVLHFLYNQQKLHNYSITNKERYLYNKIIIESATTVSTATKLQRETAKVKYQ